MTDRERRLLQTLYDFYSEGSKDLKSGDTIKYNYPSSGHHNKIGIFLDHRSDGKIRIKFGDKILITRDKYCIKIAEEEKNYDKLINILKQMVEDRDLSQEAVDKFLRELKNKSKKKKIDPYDEENWDDEEKDAIIKPRKKEEREESYDPCGRGNYSRGC